MGQLGQFDCSGGRQKQIKNHRKWRER